MKNLKSREEFTKENSSKLESLQLEIDAPVVNEKFNVRIDAIDTKKVEVAMKEIGAKIVKIHDFGVIEVEADPKQVAEIKKIDDVTDVEAIKDSKVEKIVKKF